jgi:type II secretory pathway component PulM
MHIIAIAIFFFLLGLGVIFFFVALWGAWVLYRYLQQRKQQRAHRLATYLRRLRPVVAELLRQANELDQASKYSGLDKEPAWVKKYGEALHKLLDANNKLEETNVALVEQELASAQDCLLYVIRTIHVVSYRLKEMEPIEEIVELKAELKLEHERAMREAEAKKHSGDTRAADASHGQTSNASKSQPKVEKVQTHHSDTQHKADGHSVLKIPDKKQEILRDEKGKSKS